VIEGLKGKAAYGDGKRITVNMLDLYISERVKTLSSNQEISTATKSYDLPDFVVAEAQSDRNEVTQASVTADDYPRQMGDQQNEVMRRLPPVISILSPQDGAMISSRSITVRYAVRLPTEEPVTEVMGLLDGRPFPFTTPQGHRVSSGDSTPVIREFQVDLSESGSQISLIARNRWAISEPATIRVRRTKDDMSSATVAQPTLYALVIGVSHYENASLELQFPAKDALDFSSVLERQQGALYKTVKTKILTDLNATKGNILEGLDWLDRQVSRNDVAVIFFAGHGVTDKNGLYYFLPVDANTSQLRRSGLAFSDIRNGIASLAGKTLLFADTCHAGNVFGKRRGAVDINAVVNELTSAENGVVVFASSTGKQDSLEDPAWLNGAFTKALVEALSGKAAYGGSKKITINMLDLYVSERVKELTRGQQTPTTTKPQTIQDFPVAVQLQPL
jgi:hypothetical protein